LYSIKVDEDSTYDYKSQTSKPKSQRNKSQGQLREKENYEKQDPPLSISKILNRENHSRSKLLNDLKL